MDALSYGAGSGLGCFGWGGIMGGFCGGVAYHGLHLKPYEGGIKMRYLLGSLVRNEPAQICLCMPGSGWI